jgi:VanZ family protein
MMEALASRKNRRGLKKKHTFIRILIFIMFSLPILFYLWIGIKSAPDTIRLTYSMPSLIKVVDLLTPNTLRFPYGEDGIENKEKTVLGNYSGGSATYTMSPNAEIHLSFDGKKIEWYGYKRTYFGYADIFIDEEFQSQVLLHSNKPVNNHLIFSSEELPEGPHELHIKANYYMDKIHDRQYALNVDFFQIHTNVSKEIIENDDMRVEYINPNHYYYTYFIMRKIVHLLFYFYLTLITFLSLSLFRRPSTAIVFIIPFLVATIDESSQIIIVGRYPSLLDLAIDSTGIILGVFTIWFSIAIKKRLKV